MNYVQEKKEVIDLEHDETSNFSNFKHYKDILNSYSEDLNQLLLNESFSTYFEYYKNNPDELILPNMFVREYCTRKIMLPEHKSKQKEPTTHVDTSTPLTSVPAGTSELIVATSSTSGVTSAPIPAPTISTIGKSTATPQTTTSSTSSMIEKPENIPLDSSKKQGKRDKKNRKRNKYIIIYW